MRAVRERYTVARLVDHRADEVRVNVQPANPDGGFAAGLQRGYEEGRRGR